MTKIKTYQDLLKVGQGDQEQKNFIIAAINEHKSSHIYQFALDAEKYYEGENPTINRYEKILYDLQGRAHKDMYTANHKIASSFFGFNVDQQVSYLLGNGVTFSNKETKNKLGKNFDQNVMDAAEFALVAGISFAFWNLNHIQIFKLSEFVPLYDEEDGALKAGIRFWQVDLDKPLRATFYEMDGYTDYIQSNGESLHIMRAKRPYKQIVRHSEVDGTEIYNGENYPGFPIIPLKNGRNGKSALAGKRNTVDALDLASSNMVNNVDEGNLIYWVLSNCGGMDDLDDVKFIERLKTLHVAHADGDDGAKAEAHTIEAPYNGTAATIDMLQKKLYQDFQCFDASAVSAGNQTATAIIACYVPLDLKTDKFESWVTRFINEILEIAGIDDTPSYTRNKIVNKAEETQTVLMGAEYYDDEYITKKLLTINGDADQYDELIKRKQAEETERVEEEANFPSREEPEVIDDGNTRPSTPTD